MSADRETLRVLLFSPNSRLSTLSQAGRRLAGFQNLQVSGVCVRKTNFALAKTDSDAFYAIKFWVLFLLFVFYHILNHIGVSYSTILPGPI